MKCPQATNSCNPNDYAIKTTSSLKYPHWLKQSKSDRIANALVIVTLAGFWVAILISILAS